MLPKLKSFFRSEQSFLAGLLCLVGLASFQLGQASVDNNADSQTQHENQAGVIFTDVSESLIASDATRVVASSGGTKYHKLDCPGAGSIKEDNKIYFNSMALAKAAGYTAASNCEF